MDLELSALIEERFSEQVNFLQRMVQSRSSNRFTPELSPPMPLWKHR